MELAWRGLAMGTRVIQPALLLLLLLTFRVHLLLTNAEERFASKLRSFGIGNELAQRSRSAATAAAARRRGSALRRSKLRPLHECAV